VKKWLLFIVLIIFFACVGYFIFRKDAPLSLKNSIQYIAPSISVGSGFSLLKQEVVPSLSIDSIYINDHTWTATLSAVHKRVLVASGDIIPARSVNFQTVKRGNYMWAFQNISSILSSGDSTVVNLETPLLSQCPVTVEGMIFCGSKRHIEGLRASGVDVVGLSNNHIGNYGRDGIEETKKLLEENGMSVTGINGPVVRDVKGLKFSFLAYNEIGTPEPMVSWLDEETMVQEIIQAKKTSDVVIVMLSWGVEYTDRPTENQRRIGKIAIDAGADLILGNHPHWIQGVELYKGKLIVYAQGNTIFDQMWSEETKKGVIGKYTFYDKELIDVEFIPTYIKDYGQPVVLDGKEKDIILQKMKTVSY